MYLYIIFCKDLGLLVMYIIYYYLLCNLAVVLILSFHDGVHLIYHK
jgi:hypothetical protein